MNDLREKIARAISETYGDLEWELWDESADAVLAVLREQEPVAWAATDEDGKIEALSFNQSRRRFDTPLYAAPMPPSVPEGCKWALTEPTDEDLWESDCGAAWTFIDGGPTENGMRFCLACGRVLEVVAPKPGEKE